MKKEIIRLLQLGNDVDTITETLTNDRCMAEELKEDTPPCCGENAECYECWRNRIIKIKEEM